MINTQTKKRNFYSQYGEDGIIEFLLSRIPEANRTNFAIEFGAADGLFCSNTARLWRDQGFDALLIESDDDLFGRLQANTTNYPNVEIVKALVRRVEDYTDRVADVCSIDIDGNDYHVAERLSVKHNVVIIEHNPTIPPHVEMVGIEDSMYGSSAKSIVKMMNSKGYSLVGMTLTNCIFVLGHHYDLVCELEELFDYSALNYVCTSYDEVYDFIGRFPYGFGRPGNLRLNGRPDEKSLTVDSATMEYMRQIVAIQDGKS